MGFENPSMVDFFVNVILIAFFFYTFAFIIRCVHEPQEKPVNSVYKEFMDSQSSTVSDDDVYAMTCGDEDYLAAHCTVSEIVTPTPKPKPVAPKPQTSQQFTHPLLDDSIAALTGLGFNKTQAKKTATEILKQGNINTINDVLRKAMKK